MLELLVNPKKTERKPWEMLFIGFFYAALSIVLCIWLFSNNTVLSQYMGIFAIMFCVIFSTPFIYYTIKLEERKDLELEGETTLLKEHGKAMLSFLFLFLGFVVAFSIGYVILEDSPNLFKAQIETFCQINRGGNYEGCLRDYGISMPGKITGEITGAQRFFEIFSNNIYVLIFTLVLSLLFGAGAVFVLAWNASVIAAAIGIFARNQLQNLHLGFGRYVLFHGLLEIGAYFMAALAGGIISTAVIKHDYKSEKFWDIIQDSLNLIVISIIILVIAGLIEVFITPKLF